MLVVRGELYINLQLELLTKHDEVRVFPDRETAEAYKALIHTTSLSWRTGRTYLDLQVNSVVFWGNKKWMIVNVCEAAISLVGEADTLTEIPISAFEQLVQEGRITGITPGEQTTHPEVKRRLSRANQRIFAEANRRYHIVRAFIQGEPLPKGNKIAERTLRHWKAKYCAAQMAYGNGYIGLLSQRKVGNIKKKLPEQSIALMNEFIDGEYENHKQKTKASVYSIYQGACTQHGVLPASYKTFCRAVKQRPRYIQTLKRQGRKGAYDYKELLKSGHIYKPASRLSRP